MTFDMLAVDLVTLASQRVVLDDRDSGTAKRAAQDVQEACVHTGISCSEQHGGLLR